MTAENNNRRSLVDRVTQHLTAQMACRKLKLGERISARQVAEDLAVSRTTVNKAIENLVSSGWVKPDRGHHPVVVELPPQQAAEGADDFAFSNQTDTTYENLLQRILAGEFKMGEIIKERKVAMDMGVNPATVRRASEWLSRDGLLERLPRRGWQVCYLEPRDLQDAYELRVLLEPMAIAGATRRMTDERLDELEAETDQLIELAENATVLERRNADDRFHLAILESSGNKILYETVMPLVRRLLLITTVGFRFGRSERSFEEHKQVIESLRNRDEKDAARLLKQHLRNALKFNTDIWEQRRG